MFDRKPDSRYLFADGETHCLKSPLENEQVEIGDSPDKEIEERLPQHLDVCQFKNATY